MNYIELAFHKYDQKNPKSNQKTTAAEIHTSPNYRRQVLSSGMQASVGTTTDSWLAGQQGTPVVISMPCTSISHSTMYYR